MTSGVNQDSALISPVTSEFLLVRREARDLRVRNLVELAQIEEE